MNGVIGVMIDYFAEGLFSTALIGRSQEKIKWPYAQVNLYNDTMFFIDINLY